MSDVNLTQLGYRFDHGPTNTRVVVQNNAVLRPDMVHVALNAHEVDLLVGVEYSRGHIYNPITGIVQEVQGAAFVGELGADVGIPYEYAFEAWSTNRPIEDVLGWGWQAEAAVLVGGTVSGTFKNVQSPGVIMKTGYGGSLEYGVLTTLFSDYSWEDLAQQPMPFSATAQSQYSASALQLVHDLTLLGADALASGRVSIADVIAANAALGYATTEVGRDRLEAI